MNGTGNWQVCKTDLRVEVALGTVLVHDELCRLVRLDASFRELGDFEQVGIAHRRGDVHLERRVRDVLVVELEPDAVFAWKQKNSGRY